MVSSMKREVLTLAISLLVMVISLTNAAMAATAPAVSIQTRIAPAVMPFAGSPGKIARGADGMLYVTDYWAQGIVKFDKNYNRIGLIATGSRPVGVAVLSNNNLVVTMQAPRAFAAIYDQLGNKVADLGAGYGEFFRPTGVTVDSQGYIYVVESGDFTSHKPYVAVYDGSGAPVTTNARFDASYPVNSFGSIAPIGGVKPNGKLLEPVGITYDKASNQLVVADTMNGRFQYFWPKNGVTPYAHVKTYGSLGINPMQFSSPQGVAIEYVKGSTPPVLTNRAYVVEKAKHKVVVVDTAANAGAGAELRTINGSTVTGGTILYGNDVIVDPYGCLLVSNVASSTPANIAAFGIDGATCPPITTYAKILSYPHSVLNPGTATLSGETENGAAVTCTPQGGTPVNANVTGISWSCTVQLTQANNANGVTVSATAAGKDPGSDIASIYWKNGASFDPAPSLSITSPASPAYVAALSVNVCGTTAVGANVDVANPSTSFAVTVAANATGNWCASVPVVETAGSNVISAAAWKNGSALSAPQTVEVYADLTAPNLTTQFAFLSNNSTTNVAVQNVSGVAGEQNLASVSVNGQAATLVSLGAGSTYYSFPATLIRGTNIVTVVATDRAGNSASIARTVTLTPELPAFAVTSPVDNIYVQGMSTVDFSGTVADASTAVEVGGVTAIVNPDRTWTATAVPIRGGLVGYDAVATPSPVGSVPTTLKRAISEDNNYAPISITDPPADAAVKTASYSVHGKVATSGVNTITVENVNGSAVTVTTFNPVTGDFSFTVPFDNATSAEGVYPVKVTVDMNDGRSNTAVRNFIYDATPPLLTIVADNQPRPLTLMGNVEPSSTVKVNALLGGNPVTVPDSVVSYSSFDTARNGIVWTASMTGYNYDTISFTATDPAGNVSNKTFAAGIPVGDSDVDGTVRPADAMMCLRFLAGVQNPTPPQLAQTDIAPLLDSKVNPNGQADIFDCMHILRKALLLETW